jgi:uncharacterized protein
LASQAVNNSAIIMRKSVAVSESAESTYQTALRLARRRKASDRKRIIHLLNLAISEGHVEAMHALATWYIFGVGVRKNYKKGLALEQKAAEGGIAEAAFNLAVSYETGKGVRRDPAVAFRFYKMAARLGDAQAIYEVGRCYYYGEGVTESKTTAERWLDKARDAGITEAKASASRRARR